jgi:hypothetical protein
MSTENLAISLFSTFTLPAVSILSRRSKTGHVILRCAQDMVSNHPAPQGEANRPAGF